jgi:hypothetical protein
MRSRRCYAVSQFHGSEDVAVRKLRNLAFAGNSLQAFDVYTSWLHEARLDLQLGSKSVCKLNAEYLGVLIVALHVDVGNMSAQQYFREPGEIDWVRERLEMIEKLANVYDPTLHWKAYRSLVKLERSLHRVKNGLDGINAVAKQREAARQEGTALGKRWKGRMQLSDAQIAGAQSAIDVAERMRCALMAAHGKEAADVYRGGERWCVELLRFEQARGAGLDAVMRAYEGMLAAIDDDFAGTALNTALLRVAITEMNEQLGQWHLRLPPANTPMAIDEPLAGQLRALLAIVSTMRNLDAGTLASALSIARALNDSEATALVLDALEHNSDGIASARVAGDIIAACHGTRARNGVAVVDHLWRLFRNSAMQPTSRAVSGAVHICRRAAAVDKAIAVYETSTGELGTAIDERLVAALVHAIADQDAEATPTQVNRVLSLALASGFAKRPYVRHFLSKLPQSIVDSALEKHKGLKKK